MTFFKYQKSDSTNLIRLRSEILYHLLNYRNSLSEIESNYEKTGKHAVREIVSKTTSWLLLLIIGQLLLSVWYFPSLPFVNGFTVFLVVYFLYLLLCWFIPSKLFFRIFINRQKNKVKKKIADEVDFLKSKKRDRDEELLFQFYENTLSDDRQLYTYFLATSNEYRHVRNFLLQSPFSLRTIWIWTLIIGLALSIDENDIKLIIKGTFEKDVLNKFALSVLKSFTISIISYIATNVVFELLQLREQYVQGKEEMTKLKDIITKSEQEISLAYEKLSLFGGTNDLNIAFSSLRDRIIERTDTSLSDAFNKLANTMISQFETFKDKITYNRIINRWVISAINYNTMFLTENFKKNNTLISTYDIFGHILTCTLEDVISTNRSDLENYEIYTLFVLPPERFLNYDRDENNTLGLSGANENWRKFIDINLKSAKKGIKQFRHFLSIDIPDEDEDVFKTTLSEEEQELYKYKIRDQLSKSYQFREELEYFKIHYYPLKDPADDHKVVGYHYPTETDKKSVKLEEGFKWSPYPIILDKIHSVNGISCCKILEVEYESYKNDVQKRIRNNERPIDYYAIRHNKGTKESENWEWLLCFKTEYDKRFNSAFIKLLHKEDGLNYDEWKIECNTLNKIFFNKKNGKDENTPNGIKIYPITQYLND